MRSLLFFLMIAAAPAAAQSTPLLGPTPGSFIALSVADIDRMTTWYRDTLGFTVYSQGQAPNNPQIRFALLHQNNSILEIIQLPDAKPFAEVAPGRAGPWQVHGSFKVGFVVEQLDSVYAHFQRQGREFAFRLSELDGPYRAFGFIDPEGNLIQFFGR